MKAIFSLDNTRFWARVEKVCFRGKLVDHCLWMNQAPNLTCFSTHQLKISPTAEEYRDAMTD